MLETPTPDDDADADDDDDDDDDEPPFPPFFFLLLLLVTEPGVMSLSVPLLMARPICSAVDDVC